MCDTKLFFYAQIDKIEKDKWIQGQIQNSDPGEHYILEWVMLHAEAFRFDWNTSVCKECMNCSACGYNVFKTCSRFKGS